MTQALHDIMSSGSIDINDHEKVHVLAREVLLTDDEVLTDGDRISDEQKAELTNAALFLAKSDNIDAISSVASTAALTGDKELYKLAIQKIKDKYPTDTDNEISNYANRHLRDDTIRAMELVRTKKIAMAHALILATTIGDELTNNHPAFAAVDDERGIKARIAIDNQLATEKARIRARHEIDDDTDKPYDPFAEDEDEEKTLTLV
jgi:hypothetical protein